MGKTLGDLTDMQAAFVAHYLVSLNGKDAALKAGYSPETAESQASQLLKNPKVSAEIKKRMERRAKRLDVTADNVLRELARIGFSDIRRTMTFHPDLGVTVIPSNEIDDDDAAAIAEINDTKTSSSGAKGDFESRSTKIKLHDKIRALDLMGRHLGMWEGRKDAGGAEPIALAYVPKSQREKEPA